MLELTLRMGAAHYDLTTTEGAVIDLATLTKAERNKVRRLIVSIYEKETN